MQHGILFLIFFMAVCTRLQILAITLGNVWRKKIYFFCLQCMKFLLRILLSDEYNSEYTLFSPLQNFVFLFSFRKDVNLETYVYILLKTFCYIDDYALPFIYMNIVTLYRGFSQWDRISFAEGRKSTFTCTVFTGQYLKSVILIFGTGILLI